MAGPLAVSVGADITAYEKAMSRAGEIAARQAMDISKNFVNAAANINTAFSGARGLANLPGQFSAARSAALGLAATGAGIVAAFALMSGSIKQANEQIDRFVKIGENAERAGVGVGFFQRFSEAAKEAKIEVAGIEAALKRAGDAVTPKFEQVDGIRERMRDLFESGYLGNYQSQAMASYRAAGNNEDRIRAAVQAMRELRNLGEGLAAIDLAERLFGADVAERIRSGRLEIESIIDSLNRQRDDLVKQEEVDRAAEFKERLAEAYATIDEALHVSLALAEAGRAINDIWLSIAEATAKASTVAGSYLDKMLAAAKAARDAQPPSALQSPLANKVPSEGRGNIAADLGADAGRGARGRTIYDSPAGPAPAKGFIENVPLPPRRPLDMVLAERAAVASPAKSGGGSGSSASELDEIERFINTLDKSTVSLKAQVDAFHLSNSEQAVALQLARAHELAKQNNKTLTEEETRRIREAATAASDYKDKLANLQQQQNQTAELARTLGNALSDSFADAILEGESLSDVLSNLAKQIARMALQAAFTGQGPLAGLFGMAPAASEGSSAVGGIVGMLMKGFAGGFAEGGVIQGPGTGTSDSILAAVSTGEFVVNAASTAQFRPWLEAINAGKLPAFAEGGIVGSGVAMPKGASSPGGSQVFTIAPAITVNANGGNPAQNADLAAQTAKAAEGAIRAIIVDEIMTQRRPGNMLGT